MIVGCVKEIKIGENRVGLTPYGVHSLVSGKHTVLIEKNAGIGSGFSNEDYEKAGAKIIATAKAVFDKADMIIKVKEPQKSEFSYFRKGQILYTYLHLAAEKDVTDMLLKKGVVGIAYETVELPDGSLPLLTPMSEVAGRMAVHIGSYFLQKPNGGLGRLLSGIPGVKPGNVVILGTGVVSTNAAKIAIGMGADVIMFGRNLERMRYLDDIFYGKTHTQASNPLAIEEALRYADLVVSGVLIPGAKAPKLVTRKMLKSMRKGAVIVDVAIDQGGSTETSKPTSHADPIYEVDGIIHYCVTNMPGAVPRTSTLGLTNATIKYALDIANKGWKAAVEADPALAKGVNTVDGKLTYEGVAEAFNMKYTPLSEVM